MENPNGAVGGNSQNTPTAITPRTRSTFPLGYHFFDTHRFGEYHPHYVEEGVKEDVLPVRSSHQVMSYTLKAPLMQNITMSKDYFSVPMEAILPLNWEKFFDNPVRGDDVLANVGPTMENFWNKIGGSLNQLKNSLSSLLTNTSTTDNVALAAVLRFLVFGEYIYSNGSLLSSLGCHGAPYINVSKQNSSVYYTYDDFFDAMVDAIVTSLQGSTFTVSIDGYSYIVSGDQLDHIGSVIPMRHLLCLVRDNPIVTVSNIGSQNMRSDLATEFAKWNLIPYTANVPLNTSRLWAYQLCCAHYYSNDHIDFVYSAELYRQLIGSYINGFITSVSGQTFTRNGISYRYDYCSAFFLAAVINITSNGAVATQVLNTTNSQATSFLGYMSALFGYRRSLRYQDYFTGSRAQPLAVGSTGVAVVNNTVDVVDVTRNIQRQRFLNAVNRVRHNFEGYLQGIFGGDVPAPDYHNPFFLATTTDSVYGQETENTGSAQMQDNIAITSNLRSNGSRYMLEVHCDRPCVIIGITHYDLPRVYAKSTERVWLHVDRFDWFNPFMQFIGDQPLYIQELGINPGGTALSNMANFAYSLRHMEYKQRFNQAAGGFVKKLPGFAFLAVDDRGSQSTINPDWIRSVNSEFDDFYVSLSGWSNGSYFHFIVDNYNDCSGSRPMAYAPTIL